MSIKVMSRVWEHATHKGGSLLLLLALADYADDRGICWPGLEALAEKARLTERQAVNVIHGLIASGDVVSVPGRGRGKHTAYGILTGLTGSACEKVKLFLCNDFGEIISPLSEKKVKFLTEKGEISSTKKVKFLTENEEASSAPERTKPPQLEEPIRHEIRHDPSSPSSDPPKNTDESRRMMVMMLMQKGVKAAASARKIADQDLDFATVETSIDNMLADGAKVGAIVRMLEVAPPPPGQPYPRVSANGSARPPPRASPPAISPDALSGPALGNRVKQLPNPFLSAGDKKHDTS
jgi:hypothetical protein